ncbi:protein lifeguard 3-like, partial [Clarias magur]
GLHLLDLCALCSGRCASYDRLHHSRRSLHSVYSVDRRDTHCLRANVLLYSIMEPSDPDEFCKNKSVRYKFMGKVFLILSAQMLFIMFIVALFMFIDPVRLFVRQYPGLFFFPSLLFFFTTYFLILSCHKARRQFPWNLVLLVTFTLAMSFLAGVTSSCLDAKSLLFLLGTMTYECLAILVNFWFEEDKDTDCAFMIYILALILPNSGFLVVFAMYARFIRVIDVILTVHGLTFYTFFSSTTTTRTFLQTRPEMSEQVPMEALFPLSSIWYSDTVKQKITLDGALWHSYLLYRLSTSSPAVAFVYRFSGIIPAGLGALLYTTLHVRKEEKADLPLPAATRQEEGGREYPTGPRPGTKQAERPKISAQVLMEGLFIFNGAACDNNHRSSTYITVNRTPNNERCSATRNVRASSYGRFISFILHLVFRYCQTKNYTRRCPVAFLFAVSF